MRRLNLDGGTGPQNVAWPDSPSKLPISPFQPRPELRQLSIVVDTEALADDSDDPWSARRQLAGILSRNEYIRLIRYSDDGPPIDAPKRTVSHGPDLAIGWVTPETDPQIGGEHFWYADPASDGPTFTGYYHSVADHVASTTSTAVPPQSDDQRRRAGVAAAVAQAIGPDLFITARPHLLGLPSPVAGLTTCSVEQALALIGLYLRTQGDYRIWFAEDGGWTMTVGKGFYYWIAARNLVSEAWRRTSACGQHAQGGDDALIHLTLSALQRVHSTLAARDVVHRALNQPQTRRGSVRGASRRH